MNLHEYQSKQLFSEYAIPVPKGEVANSPEAAVAAAPYVHSRLSAATLKATVTPLPAPPYDPEKLTPEQREVMREVLLLTRSS